MSEQKINRLRKRFILASTLSFFMVMLLMGGIIYLFTTVTERNEVSQIINYIIRNDGDFPQPSGNINESSAVEESMETLVDDEEIVWSLEHFFGTGDVLSSAGDFFLRMRYFAVLFDEQDEVEEVKTQHMGKVSEEKAVRYAWIARRRFFDLGSFGTYYYGVSERESGGTIVVYLDRTSQIFTTNRIFYITLILLGAGSMIAFLIMRGISYRIVQPEIDNANLQKQFITNASHELKTPLAVIRANTEMQEMLEGESEWTKSTMRQVGRMEGLIKNLVMIARSQEKSRDELTAVELSRPVRETAESFLAVAASEGKTLSVQAEEEMTVLGEESSIRQLVSLLTDNAVKYCDESGQIRAVLKRRGRHAELQIFNTYADGSRVDTSRFFERFYREDSSHNEKGGYGIGLSVAESLVKQMKGTIDAAWKDGEIVFTCQFPLMREGNRAGRRA